MAKCFVRPERKDKTPGKDASNTDLLLHPELLSRDFIQLVLHEKKIQVGADGERSRDCLTELYLQHVIPMPQRELPKSRWGQRVAKTRESQSPAHSQRLSSLSGNDNVRKRPLIVFDGSSTKTGTIKLKKSDCGVGLGLSDRLRPPPSGNLANPIRKLPGAPAKCSASEPSPKSPIGNEKLRSPTCFSSGGAMATTVKLKRSANSEGESESLVELKSPEVKKKIQHITWP